VHQENARVAGDCDTDLVSDLEPVRSFEPFLVEKDEHVPFQLAPVLRAEMTIEGHVPDE
jgi:hypothetical protein